MPQTLMPQRTSVMEDDLDFVMPYIKINPDNLTDDMVQHVSSYVYLAQFAAEAAGTAADTKDAVSATKAQKFVEFKLGGMEDGKKFPTDETVKAAVEQDEDVIKAKEDAASARMDEIFWNYVMDAFQQRGFLIKELASLNSQGRNDISRSFNMDTRHELEKQRSRDAREAENDAAVRAPQLTRDSMLNTMRSAIRK